ncbi:unnamed protein product [Victoria cruziana]
MGMAAEERRKKGNLWPASFSFAGGSVAGCCREGLPDCSGRDVYGDSRLWQRKWGNADGLRVLPEAAQQQGFAGCNMHRE